MVLEIAIKLATMRGVMAIHAFPYEQQAVQLNRGCGGEDRTHRMSALIEQMHLPHEPEGEEAHACEGDCNRVLALMSARNDRV
jgi:hypothetical protein